MGYNFEQIDKGTEEFPVSIFGQTAYIPDLHHHCEFEIFYIDSGSATVTIKDSVYKAKKGSIFFIYPGTDHCVANQSKDFHYYAIVFDNSIINNTSNSTKALFNQIIIDRVIKLDDNILSRLATVSDQFYNKVFGREIGTISIIYEIIFYIINTNQFAPLPAFKESIDEKKSIENGINYIKSHFTENITLDDLLKCTNYSKSHFIRLFKATTGVNYTEYLNRYRVDKACRELIYSKKNITQIATENGFNNIQYFSKIFKKYMNVTPKQYQKKCKVKK